MRTTAFAGHLGQEVEFNRTKYGPELLVDCAWVGEMPTFFRPGPHHLTFYEILLIERGEGQLLLDGAPHDARARKVFFTCPGQTRTWSSTNVEGLCLFFPALFLDEFFQDSLFVERLPYFSRRNAAELALSPTAAKQLKHGLLMIRDELQALRPDSVHLMRAKLYEVLIVLARNYASAHGSSEHRAHPVVSRFRQELAKSARQHQVSGYARRLGVTPGHLNALCKVHLQQTAKAAIQDAVFVEARRALLYSDATVEAIAYRLGFKDASYFARFFRRRAEMAPGAFRKQNVPKRVRATAAGLSPGAGDVHAKR
jgi:AraC-like DNA-binding protein